MHATFFFFFWLYIWKIRRLLYLNLFGGTLSPTGQTWRAHFRFLVSKTRLKQFLPDGLLCKLSVLLTSPDTNLAHNELFSEIDTRRTFRNRKQRIKRPKSGYVQLCVHMWRSHQWCLVTAENRTDQVWKPPVLHLKHGQTCLATATLSIHNHQKMMVSVYKGHSRRTRACPQRELTELQTCFYPAAAAAALPVLRVCVVWEKFQVADENHVNIHWAADQTNLEKQIWGLRKRSAVSVLLQTWTFFVLFLKNKGKCDVQRLTSQKFWVCVCGTFGELFM